MKIVKANAKETRFDELEHGIVFEWNASYYMVICTDSRDNAVEMDTGMTVYFEDHDMVIPVGCELVIK